MTETTTISFVLYIVQILILPAQIIGYLTRTRDKTRLRFLILLLSFILINSFWIFSASFFGLSESSRESAFLYLGCGLVSYIYFYFIIEIKLDVKWRTPLILFLTLLLCSVFVQLIEYHLLELDNLTTKVVNLFLYEFIALTFGVKCIIELLKKIRTNHQPIYFAAIVVFLLAIFLPLFNFGIDESYFGNLFVNLIFALIVLAYMIHYIVQVKSESEIYESESSFSRLNLTERYSVTTDPFIGLNLTEREQELVKLMVDGHTYNEIAEKTFISASTVRKHASSIFNKVGVSNLREFTKKFRSFRPN